MKTDWGGVSGFETPEDSPGFLLWKLTNRWQRAMRACLAPLGLTHVQFVLIACLGWMNDHSEEPVTQKQLAENAGTDPMMTSQVVRALVEGGLVSRLSHPTDKRAFSLRLTPIGMEKVAAAIPAVEAADRRFFAENQGEIERLAARSHA